MDIILESCDKQLLGQVCSKIRSFRKLETSPEEYINKVLEMEDNFMCYVDVCCHIALN